MILRLHAVGAAWSVENPAGSLMWLTDPFVELLESIPDLIAFSFHTCMFSAPRKKDTAIWASFQQLRTHLERKCDDTHEHLPWGLAESANGFATAAECAYNEHMCASWAQAVVDMATERGFTLPPKDLQCVDNFTNVHINKTILGCLPRGRKVPPLLTDWLEPQVFDIGAYPQIQQLPVGKRIPDNITLFPAGSKLVRFTNANGGDFDGPLDGTSMPSFAMVGIPREPSDFISLACTVVHPMKRAMQIGDAMLNAIDSYELGDGLEFMRVQCAFSQKLLRLCSELREAEEARHIQMPAHLQKVLNGKRIVLFQRLLEECNYPDSKIAGEMANGFPLCGMLPASGVFPPMLRPPDLHVDTLERMSASFTARAVASTRATNDVDLDKKLWQATLEEAEAGFLTGPYDVGSCPKDAVVSPRFGLLQKSKLRPIDNFSASHVNSATGLQDKLQVDTIDEICAMIKAWAQRYGPEVELVGRSYDLRKAYRQIGISEGHLKFAWISVWSPDDACAKLFRMDSMPFGATASVGAFLRLSQALKCLGISSAALVWSSFYDDFVCICPLRAAKQVDRMVRLLFQVLGWQLSTDESKDQDFGKVFQALGVEFNLTNLRKGFFTVGNTESRKLEIGAKIDAILKADYLSVTEATSMRSRLLFADAQVFGRFAKSALHEIGSVGLACRDMSPLSESVKRSLIWMKERVVTSVPRKIDFVDTETFYLFLDGACTDFSESSAWSGTSIGGVLVFPDGSVRQCFGEILPRELMAGWGRDDQQQYIFEAEVMPYAVSLLLWKDILRRKCIFVFIDNEGARAAWISGFASTRASQHMLHIGTSVEAQLESHPYFARVPTHSNIGDAPSRGRFHVIEKFGGRRMRVPAEVLERLMVHGGERWTFDTSLEAAYPKLLTDREFAEKALKALEAIQFVVGNDPRLVEIERKKNLLKAKIRARQLETQERELHRSLATPVQKVVKGKKLLLWKQLLEELAYDDMEVVSFMTKGVPLAGAHDHPEVYPLKIKPAVLTEAELRDNAPYSRKALIARRPQTEEPGFAAHLVETAKEEKELDFLEGPFSSEEEVSNYLGHSNWRVIRRFVIQQGQKLRPSDDGLEYSSTIRLDLQDADYVIAMVLELT
eukprot:s2135_g11.t1